MSKLKINDLSFCETEHLNIERVQGGFLSFSANGFFNSFFSRLKPLGSTVLKDGTRVQELYDPQTDSSGMIISRETENSRIETGTLTGNLRNDGKSEVSFAAARSFNMSL